MNKKNALTSLRVGKCYAPLCSQATAIKMTGKGVCFLLCYLLYASLNCWFELIWCAWRESNALFTPRIHVMIYYCPIYKLQWFLFYRYLRL